MDILSLVESDAAIIVLEVVKGTVDSDFNDRDEGHRKKSQLPLIGNTEFGNNVELVLEIEASRPEVVFANLSHHVRTHKVRSPPLIRLRFHGAKSHLCLRACVEVGNGGFLVSRPLSSPFGDGDSILCFEVAIDVVADLAWECLVHLVAKFHADSLCEGGECVGRIRLLHPGTHIERFSATAQSLELGAQILEL
jgi:hypothetical protein